MGVALTKAVGPVDGGPGHWTSRLRQAHHRDPPMLIEEVVRRMAAATGR